MAPLRLLIAEALLALFFLAAVSSGTEASPARCLSSALSFDASSSTIKTGNFIVILEGADDAKPPDLWEGPVKIESGTGAPSCSVDVPNGLINKPLFAMNDHFIVFVTSSGSNFSLTTIDLQQCKIAAITHNLTGPITYDKERVLANGNPVSDFICRAAR